MRLLIALVAAVVLVIGASPVRADNAPAAAAAPQMTGWFEQILDRFEAEASSDVSMAPDVFTAIGREWRSFDRNGSSLGVFGDIALVALVAIAALFVERAIGRALSQRPRRRMGKREGGAKLVDVLGLLACDIAGLAGFVVVLGVASRHFLPAVGITAVLAMFAANILIRWRVVSLIFRAILRPDEAAARLVELPDHNAKAMARKASALVFAIILLVGFGRYGLMDEDSGAPHVIGLLIASIVFPLYGVAILYSRRAGEALIRGRRKTGLIALFREAIAPGWVPVGLLLVALMYVFFVAGLSLGLLRYSQAVYSTLGILFVLLVVDRLTEWELRDVDAEHGGAVPTAGIAARTIARILRGVGFAVGAMFIAWVWIDAIEVTEAMREPALRSASSAIATLFVAFLIWELVRLAIDRHLENVGGGPAMPGAAHDDEEVAPASRLQTVLPMLRAAFAVLIGVVAALIVLSRLGVDTAPLIAGAGVFGLAVSFGSQSLVRDIISGLFYMWDDAFRVGEYIDTGRLKGTVETLGIRSVKLRHQNGPLHTIPYGQLGAVTNLSRDFATIKFNLRFEPGTDIELVRKSAKQLGLAMQDDNPELAAEVMQPLKLQGVAEVVDNAVVLRFKFTARPVKPSWVQREYLKRMVKVFDEKGIKFATGATMVLQTPSPLVSASANDDPSKAAEASARATATTLAAANIVEAAGGN